MITSAIAKGLFSTFIAKSTRYTLLTPFWMSSTDDGLQDRGAIATRTSWPTIRPLRKLLPLNVSVAFLIDSTAEDFLIDR